MDDSKLHDRIRDYFNLVAEPLTKQYGQIGEIMLASAHAIVIATVFMTEEEFDIYTNSQDRTRVNDIVDAATDRSIEIIEGDVPDNVIPFPARS
jgi:hypothetical protein